MKTFFMRLVAFSFLAGYASKTFCQQSTVKKIYVTVTDAATGKAMSEAEVQIRGVLLGGKKRSTDTYGKAYFEVVPILQTVTVEVTDGGILSGHKPFKESLTISASQEIYNYSAVLKSDYKGVAVTVFDNATNNPLANAKVTLKGANDTKDIIEYTDAGGSASFRTFSPNDAKTIPVIIEKDGYKRYNSSINTIYKTSNYSVSARLDKEKNTKTLQVIVNDESNNPIPEATVIVEGKSFEDFYRNPTDQSGTVNLVIKSGGDFTVKVTHGNFESAEKPITIKTYSNAQDAYALSFALKRKKGVRPTEAHVNIFVRRQDKNGITRPLEFAKVRIGGGAEIETDVRGEATILHKIPAGEQTVITVSADGYETQKRSFIVGNDDWLLQPKDPGIVQSFTLKKVEEAKDLQLLVKVSDADNYLAITNANAIVKDYSEKAVSNIGDTKNTRGEAEITIGHEELANKRQFRLIVTATGYEDKWSDLPAELLVPGDGPRSYQVYLKKKKAAAVGQEVKYGPFYVSPASWVSTGVILPKGGSFRVEAKGEFVSAADKNFHFGPGGGGNWGWWSLAGKTGTQRFGVGKNGGGTTKDGGVLELGTPRVMNFFPEDTKDLQGAFEVYVFAKGAEDQSMIAFEDPKPNKNTSSSENVQNAKKGLEFLKKLSNHEITTGFDSKTEQIISAIKFLVVQFDLKPTTADGIDCYEEIRKYIYRVSPPGTVAIGIPSAEERARFDRCVNPMITALEYKLNNNLIK
ncbi:MAG: hypothetical protein JWQ30_2783 [Sediminibacterium sp.]|nr:hypothetical protein [Sediminibacterium sp.]